MNRMAALVSNAYDAPRLRALYCFLEM